MENIKNVPLVSILIPTYNRPHYFKIALESALAQTYSNIEIIVGDDSTNNETEKLFEPVFKKNVQNQKNLSKIFEKIYNNGISK